MSDIDGLLLNDGEKEPLNLKEWPTSKGRLYSCARPGRGTTRRSRDLTTTKGTKPRNNCVGTFVIFVAFAVNATAPAPSHPP